MTADADTLDSMLRGIAATPSVRPPMRIGEKLGGRYLIEGVIGQGGMGTVYRALDDKLGETVALKVMTGALDEQALRDEVRLAQKVTHPNVCRTFDLEDVDGYHLVKMELVPGETLSLRLLREPKLPIELCVRIARAIASGLGAAHARKIVHGDLKPGNVMLDGDRVVLMDFGIARLAADPLDGVRGTVGYMAPELVREGKADERADIYALGCVLYEMLAGEQVFRGASSVVIAARHASEVAPDVRSKRSETPRWLARAVARMLAKRPDDRLAGLATLVNGPRSRVRMFVPIALALVASAAVMWSMTRPKPWVPVVHDYDTFEENGDIMSLSPDSQWIAFSSDRDAHEKWHAYVMPRQGGAATQILPERPASFARFTRDGKSLVFHDFLAHRVYRVAITGAPPKVAGTVEDLGPGWVYDDCGDALLIVDRGYSDARLVLRFPDGHTQQVFDAQPGDAIEDARCDPTGSQIVVVAGAGHSERNDLSLVDRKGNVRRLTAGERIGGAIFDANGKNLIVSRIDSSGHLRLFEMGFDGSLSAPLLEDDGPDRVSDVSRDGRFLVFLRDEDAYFPVIASATGDHYITRKRGLFTSPRELTPNVVVVEQDTSHGYDVVTMHVDTGEISVLAHGHVPFPSLDGKTVYFASADDPKILMAIPSGGGTPVQVATLPGAIRVGTESVDGLHALLEMNDTSLAAYRIASGQAVAENARGLISVAAPGGWRAVTVYADKRYAQGAELYLVPPGEPVATASWHFPVTSMQNRWLDDHRIGYCLPDRCEVLDVTTHATTKLRLEDNSAGPPSVMADGTHVLDSVISGRVTRHIITNFDQR